MAFDRSQIAVGSPYDPLLVALLEGGLILVVGLLGWATRQPLLFTSLGPTAYELIETPNRRSAGTYSILVGHMIGLACGFASVAMLHAWSAPSVGVAGLLSSDRVFTCTIAVALTVGFNLLLKSSQPAACSTTLMVALGPRQSGQDALAIVAGVLLITALGTPLRRLRRPRAGGRKSLAAD